MDDLAGLSRDQLREELKRAETDLEDVLEMRLFTLGQTNLHIGVVRLHSLQSKWDRDEERLRHRIGTIKALLMPENGTV